MRDEVESCGIFVHSILNSNIPNIQNLSHCIETKKCITLDFKTLFVLPFKLTQMTFKGGGTNDGGYIYISVGM